MALTTVKKILDHPDKDEIISKMIMGTPAKEIKSWLDEKYGQIGESKFVLSERAITIFMDEYLDIYNHMKNDILKVKVSKSSPEEEIQLSIQSNPKYRDKLNKLVNQEIDIKQILARLVTAIEVRAEQVFDQIQENPKWGKCGPDRTLIEWFNTLISAIEKYHKIVNEAPDQIIQHNITLQSMDQHIQVFQDTIREILSRMDLETSMLFVELLNEKLSKLKETSEETVPTDVRLAEAKILSQSFDNSNKGM